jgi:hypothetical protein
MYETAKHAKIQRPTSNIVSNDSSDPSALLGLAKKYCIAKVPL